VNDRDNNQDDSTYDSELDHEVEDDSELDAGWDDEVDDDSTYEKALPDEPPPSEDDD